MAGFDPKKVSTYDWVVIVVGGLAFINSFLPWYKVDFGFASVSASAWDAGFAAWFSMLLLLAAGAIVLTAAIGTSMSIPVPVTALGLSALALVLVLLRWVTENDFTSIGLYLGLVLAAAGTVASFLAFRASGGNFNQVRRSPGAPPPPTY
jgi:hypothetical protein